MIMEKCDRNMTGCFFLTEYHKGEKERCFAYTATVACDQNNFVLGVKVAPGTVHDSQVFSDVFEEVEAVVADAGYKTPGYAAAFFHWFFCFVIQI